MSVDNYVAIERELAKLEVYGARHEGVVGINYQRCIDRIEKIVRQLWKEANENGR